MFFSKYLYFLLLTFFFLLLYLHKDIRTCIFRDTLTCDKCDSCYEYSGEVVMTTQGELLVKYRAARKILERKKHQKFQMLSVSLHKNRSYAVSNSNTDLQRLTQNPMSPFLCWYTTDPWRHMSALRNCCQVG